MSVNPPPRRSRLSGFVALAVLATACGTGSEAPRGDDFIPARDLSLAELAAGRPAPQIHELPLPRQPTDGFWQLDERVRRGQLPREQADLLLLQALYGNSEPAAAELADPLAVFAVPDAFPAQVALRMEGASAAVRQQYQSLLDAVYAGAAGAALERDAPGALAQLFSPRVAYAETLEPAVGDLPNVHVGGDGRIVVLKGEGVAEQTALRVLQAASQHWPSVRGFFGLAPGQVAALTGPIGFYDWVMLTEAIGAAEQGAIAHVAFDGGETLELQVALNGQAPLEIEASRSQLRKMDLVIEVKNELAGEVGGIFTKCSDRGTWAAMNNQPAIEVKASGNECRELSATVHEIFHCAHASSLGVAAKSAFGDAGLWAVEGGASWSEERFLPSNDSEWSMYNCYADPDVDPAACGGPVGPLAPLAQRRHSAALYFLYMQQFGGGEATVKGVLSAFAGGSGSLAGLPSEIIGEGWHDFVESTAGYEALFEQGAKRFTDLAEFPYTAGTECGAYTGTVGQEQFAPRGQIDAVAGAVVPVQVGPMAAQHAILEVSAAGDIDFIDVGFDQELEQGLATADETRITAVLLSDAGERVEDWSERWAQRDDNSPDLLLGDEITGGSLRLCLAALGDCEGVEPLHEDLYEVRLVISSARTQWGDELSGRIILVPGTFPGWKAKEFRAGKPEDEQQ